MRLPSLSAILLIGLLASTTRAQALSLDMAGGLFNEPAGFTVTGGQPGDLWVLCFADTQGPTPISLLDPADPRNWDLDLSMFTYPGFFGTLPAAATLDDGRVLVCGGNDDQNNVLASAEIYNPATNTITPTGSMSQARYFHAAVKLADGRVMVFGGSTVVDASSPINAALAIV